MGFNDVFRQFPILETERILLRPFRYEDINNYLSFFSSPEVQKYLGNLPIPKDQKAAKQWVDNMNGRYFKSKLVITWCIELKESHEAIGRIDIGGFVMKSMGDIAYYLSPQYWNKGIMTEAAKVVISFGFEQLELHRIQTTVMPENIYSLRILKKLGFKEEGLLRKYVHGKEFLDTYMLSMLKEEYFSDHKLTSHNNMFPDTPQPKCSLY